MKQRETLKLFWSITSLLHDYIPISTSYFTCHHPSMHTTHCFSQAELLVVLDKSYFVHASIPSTTFFSRIMNCFFLSNIKYMVRALGHFPCFNNLMHLPFIYLPVATISVYYNVKRVWILELY